MGRAEKGGVMALLMEAPGQLRRTPMRRQAATPRCKQCRERFTPLRPGQKIHEGCAEAYAMAMFDKRRKEAAKAERATDRATREEQKKLRELLAEAQTAFNLFIRLRDADEHCIDCGKPFEANKPGGSMDAGHYLARSIAPQHRFHEDNCFGQRKNCNRPGGTTRGAFRTGVEARIGITRLLALESDTAVHKWTRDEAREIRDTYRRKAAELRKAKAT